MSVNDMYDVIEYKECQKMVTKATLVTAYSPPANGRNLRIHDALSQPVTYEQQSKCWEEITRGGP